MKVFIDTLEKRAQKLMDEMHEVSSFIDRYDGKSDKRVMDNLKERRRLLASLIENILDRVNILEDE